MEFSDHSGHGFDSLVPSLFFGLRFLDCTLKGIIISADLFKFSIHSFQHSPCYSLLSSILLLMVIRVMVLVIITSLVIFPFVVVARIVAVVVRV